MCARHSGISKREKMSIGSRLLPVPRQSKATQAHRTTIYRDPKPVRQSQLDFMTLIDIFYMEGQRGDAERFVTV